MSDERIHVVVLTGAGVSAESGLQTFRDSGGLWEGVDVMSVASIEGWYKSPEIVLEFYNFRRKQAWSAMPNPGHYALAELEKSCKVTIITQNIDNLHERAGSSNVIHLHGELSKAISSGNPDFVVNMDDRPINLGDTCPNGHQLRPHIVWFGEPVPLITIASEIMQTADIAIVAGTSLVVYPAAGLLNYVPATTEIYLVDPKEPEVFIPRKFIHIAKNASEGLPELVNTIKGIES